MRLLAEIDRAAINAEYTFLVSAANRPYTIGCGYFAD
jgi:hypothetical protein